LRAARDGGAVVAKDAEISLDPTRDADASMVEPEEVSPDTGTNVIPDGVSTIDGSSGTSLTSGTGYSIAFANTYYSVIFDSSVTFDDVGNMVAYEASENNYLDIGNAVLVETGSNGALAWGKWVGGPVPGIQGGDYSINYDFPEGLQYMVGKRATSVPAGIAVYQQWVSMEPLISHTFGLESKTAVVDYVQFAVDYSAGSFGLQMGVTLQGEVPVSFETTGGIADVSASEGMLNNRLFDIILIEGEHELSLGGFVAEGGDALGLGFRVRHRKVSLLDSGMPKAERRDIYGVAGLARTQ
jgi:hypothetical protein